MAVHFLTVQFLVLHHSLDAADGAFRPPIQAVSGADLRARTLGKWKWKKPEQTPAPNILCDNFRVDFFHYLWVQSGAKG